MFRIGLGTLALLLASLAMAQEGKDEPRAKKATASDTKRRPSDVVFLLIEMTDADEESVAELQRLYDVLRKLDKNGDGKLDPEELKRTREQLVGDRVAHIFEKLDRDQDGKISKDEAQGRIREHFDRLDRDNDGFVTRDELRQAINERPRPTATKEPAQP